MKNRRRSRKIKFNPDSKFIESAVSEYLEKGGKITMLHIGKGNNLETPMNTVAVNDVDEFLNGAGA